MRYIFRIILASLLMAMTAFQGFGETPADSVKVYFHIGNSRFNPTIHNNGEAMDSFINLVRKAKMANRIDSIIVRGYASPDGASDANMRLSRMRGETISDLIIKRSEINPAIVRTIAEGAAWDELRKLVWDNPDVPAREKILQILDNVPIWIFNSKGVIVDGKKKRLMDLEGGRPYNWMLEHIFPQLRIGVAVALYLRPAKSGESEISDASKAKTTEAAETVKSFEQINDYTEHSVISNLTDPILTTELTEQSVNSSLTDQTLTSATITVEPSQPRPYYMALKTNMLYDLALVPNLGAEFYLGKNLSLYGEWMYAWWDSNRRHRYWRIYGGDLGLRWWFGAKAHAKPLTGHHLGVYAGALMFDFECGGTGYMGGKPGGALWDRCLVNSGIEYGYSLPVSTHFNIDFSIGLGYLGGNYIKYYPFDNDYYSEKEYKMRYFGPTKAEISLIWLIGRGNVNTKSGNVSNRKGGDE